MAVLYLLYIQKIQFPTGTKEVKTNVLTVTKINETDEKEFPPLNLPSKYFDSTGSGSGVGAYSVIRNDQSYRSYPTTTITLASNLYSIKTEPLPQIKTDAQIHGENPENDFMGDEKTKNIQKYGDVARRFVGTAKSGIVINSLEDIDLDQDGKTEKLVSLVEYGANIIGQRNVVVKGNNIIFSTTSDSFSWIIPDKTGNGFCLQWADNFKSRDGYMVTRFIVENGSFKPVYEQKIRYIRLIQK
jgi:hypothetical protein